jgi:tetratricopeptide (TPR) repeat protein/TolB-like protein
MITVLHGGCEKQLDIMSPMDGERWRRIETLYNAVVSCGISERDRLLVGADPEIKNTVELMLAQSGSRLDRLALEALADESLTTLATGTSLGRYEIEAPLGVGGMGEVFRARDTRLGRCVAIKISQERFNSRFENEARAIASLNHPHICTLYDVGPNFLVMELMEGETLAAALNRGPLSPAEISRYGAEIALALAEAHSVGIVHRDLKPSNIMITRHGVKVLDFGLARIVDQSGATQTIGVMGTPGYISPEQAEGKEVSGSTDLFSLGLILYEMAVGRLPFPGASLGLMLLSSAPPRVSAPSTERSGLAADFDALIARLLKVNPLERPQSAFETAREISALVDSSGTAAASIQPRPDSVQCTDSRRSAAVVPLKLQGFSENDQYLAVALAEAMVNKLTSTGKLLVRPMSLVMRYVSAEKDWSRLAQELNVDLVLESVVQKMGVKVRVMTQIFETATGAVTGSVKHDGSMDDLFELQDRLCEAVAAALLPAAIPVASTAAPPTANPLAYELYLRAMDSGVKLNHFDTSIAIDMLNRAVELDPSFADAWGKLAQFCVQMGNWFATEPKWYEAAERAIAKSLELDPVNCNAHCAHGLVLWTHPKKFQNRAALRALQAALKVNPHDANARQWRASILFHLGFYEQALLDVTEVLAVSPNSPLALASIGYIAGDTGDHEKSLDYYERAFRADPTFIHPNILFPTAEIYAGNLGEARVKLARGRQMVPEEPQLDAAESVLLALEGTTGKALELVDRALAGKPRLHTHHTWYYSAVTFALCGQPEKAIQWLGECAGMGLPNPHLFANDPHLKSLQGIPEFRVLLADVRQQSDQLRAEFGFR